MAKVDSAARGPKSDSVESCGRCFAIVPPDSNFCPECGAPISHLEPNASDAVVGQELAQANLLRLRGSFKEAEEQCLAILRRLPNNVTANSLLGDLALDRGDFAQAAEWYELALDLNPHSLPIQQKLVDARRLSDPDVNLPGLEAAVAGPSTRLPWWAWGAILTIVITLAAAAILPRRPAEKPSTGGVVSSKIVAPPNEDGETEKPPEQAPASNEIAEDAAFLSRLAALEGGSSLLRAYYDPRTRAAIVTFVAPTEGVLESATALARSILVGDESLQAVVLRGVRDGKTVFLADAARDRLPAEGETSGFLTSIWPAPESSTSP